MTANRLEYHREYQRKYREKCEVKAKRAKYDRERPEEPRQIIGIDGEGLTEHGQHRYLYMAAWAAERKLGELDLDPLYDPRDRAANAAARTKACLEFLLTLPQEALLLGYSLGYDYTKILEGLPDVTLYELARPELRQGKNGPRPRVWGEWTDGERSGWYKLNYVKGRFSVAKIVGGVHHKRCTWAAFSEQQKSVTRWQCRGCKALRKVTVWDIFAFFQGSFIKACKEWGVVTDDEYEQLREMKERRSTFTRAEWEEVKGYCGQECRKMASLGERLLAAHADAGLKLTSYFGAGSTASRMLKVKFAAADFIAPPPREMARAVACGFFGGRFEVSRVGPIPRKVWSYDIASAYPYQFAFLPCLAHGKWELVRSGRALRGRIERADIALVRYRLPDCDALKVDRETFSSEAAWGPFPLRAHGLNATSGPDAAQGLLSYLPENGSIVYPVTSGGGWVYREEFLTAQKHFPNVEAVEAWVFTRGCSHMPFHDGEEGRETMAQQYIRRLEWGKEGRGIVVKLGTNSCYGKTAQSVGTDPPFQSFVWAGMVTSGCRAQLLEAMARAKDPRSILMTATDGIFSLEALKLAAPRDTGTAEAARAATVRDGKLKLPLGAWETKELADGVHIIRPGIGFPLNSALEAEVKARGIGKSVLARHREEVIRQWQADGDRPFKVTRTMFFGMKSATDPPSKLAAYPTRRANYGTWEEQTQDVSYVPFPKRPRLHLDREAGSLRTWAFGPEVVSAPYARLLGMPEELSAEARAEIEAKTLLSEQPDRNDEPDDFGVD